MRRAFWRVAWLSLWTSASSQPSPRSHSQVKKQTRRPSQNHWDRNFDTRVFLKELNWNVSVGEDDAYDNIPATWSRMAAKKRTYIVKVGNIHVFGML